MHHTLFTIDWPVLVPSLSPALQKANWALGPKTKEQIFYPGIIVFQKCINVYVEQLWAELEGCVIIH